MRVTPHPAFVALLTARRGEDDWAAPLPPLDVAATWKHAAQGLTGPANYWIQQLKKHAEVKAALAMVEQAAFPQPWDRKLVAVAERLMHGTLARVIEKERGLAEMVAVKLDAAAIALNHEHPLTFGVVGPGIETYEEEWDVARALVCRAPEAAYEEARAGAHAWREGRPVRLRVLSAYLFPNEPWANADWDELLPLAATDTYVYHQMFALLACVRDEARVMAMIDQIVAAGFHYQIHNMLAHAGEIVVSLPPDGALRVVKALLAKSRGANKTPVQKLGHAMAALEGEEAALELAGLLLHPAIGPTAVEYFARFPALAQQVLPKLATGTSKAADAARSLLAKGATSDVEVAEGNDVPRVLREAPWRRRKKLPQVTFDVTPPVPATHVVWASEEERTKAANDRGYYDARPFAPFDAQAQRDWASLAPRHRPVDIFSRWGVHRADFEIPPDLSLREWNENPEGPTRVTPLRMLAIHGDKALPGLFARDVFALGWGEEELLDAQMHAPGPEAARLVASALTRRKGWRKIAQEWITAHAPVVAMTLVPAALGKESRERKEAEHAVRWAARTHKEAVVDAARALGPDAERAIHELVERDPLTDLDVKGKLPPFVRVEDLPALLTKSGKRLPPEAVEALLEILRSSSVDTPYAGLDPVLDELDTASLGDFAWGLVQAWILAGAKGTFDWIPRSLALVGDDSCARRLAPYVRDWSRKDEKKAKLCVDVLAAMGSPTALLHLSYVADKARFEDAKTYAKETLTRVAAQQGLTTDELADRTVPDLDLDEDGTATLDFGPRKFTVTFDEALMPVLKTADGARLAAFPRATKADDAALAKAASARFKSLKADAEAVAQTLLRRFERAMVARRTWKAAAFRTYVVGHPLVTHLARRLVWTANDMPFRVADDGSFADADDREVTVADDAVLVLPHPLTLGPGVVAVWSRITGDYGVVQPFEQLGRATHTLEPAVLMTNTLPRYEGRTSKPGPLMGSLEARGWQKWPDETSLSACGKRLHTKAGHEAQVSLMFSPGIDLADVAHAPDQALHAPRLSGAESWGAIDPIDLSELLRDLEFLAH